MLLLSYITEEDVAYLQRIQLPNISNTEYTYISSIKRSSLEH